MNKKHFDIVIIGAGLSGIGAAVHLKKQCPDKRVAILEARENLGGTWDLFRYPGIRSDSDMYTLGYNFKPWTDPKSIADGSTIRDYIAETAREYDIERLIRYQHKVRSADWDSERARWTVTAEQGANGEPVAFESQFLICCAGYYKYENGYTPEFAGRENFQGEIVHPQLWPEDLDYSGKRVVVIGSGATAVTLIPAMTDKAAHVTMLQRSPTYVASLPEKDALSNTLRKYLPEKAVYGMARTRNVLISLGFYNLTRFYPEKMRELLVGQVERQLGGKVDIKHFSPKYNPWDQRLCAVPDGDLFKALRKGKASVVTDHINHFTENGIRLKSGEELPADIIITATGLEIQLLGGAQLSLDGTPVDVSKKLYYKGAMLEDVPNAVMVFGYTNSSWTLKADLISEYFCRVINYMDKHGWQQCMPHNDDAAMQREPFLDLSSGYVQRALSQLPQQGAHKPWRLYQNYAKDFVSLRLRRLRDKALVFSNPAVRNTSVQHKARPSLARAAR